MSGLHLSHVFTQRNTWEVLVLELDVMVIDNALVIRRFYRLNGQMQTPTVAEERIPLAQLEGEARDWLTALALEWGSPPVLASAKSARLEAPHTPADDFTELAEELCECGHSTSFHAHHPDAHAAYCFSCDCEEFTAARAI